MTAIVPAWSDQVIIRTGLLWRRLRMFAAGRTFAIKIHEGVGYVISSDYAAR